MQTNNMRAKQTVLFCAVIVQSLPLSLNTAGRNQQQQPLICSTIALCFLQSEITAKQQPLAKAATLTSHLLNCCSLFFRKPKSKQSNNLSSTAVRLCHLLYLLLHRIITHDGRMNKSPIHAPLRPRYASLSLSSSLCLYIYTPCCLPTKITYEKKH